MRAVAIGGGHGTARTLAALRSLSDEVVAVITTADDGGSSGRLRRDLGVVPPGDLRMALSALAPPTPLAGLVEHRFSVGELDGHSLGNLMLVALVERADGDLISALDQLGALLGARGRVVPCTPAPVTLQACAPTGNVRGQAAIAATPHLQEVWLEPHDPPATRQAVEAIERADLVVIGPGSLYTSVLPNLLVADIADAIRRTPGRVVFVANLQEQVAETLGLALADHLVAIARHVEAPRIDAVLVNEADAPTLERPLRIDVGRVPEWAGVVRSASLDDGHGGHDPVALAGALRDLRSAG